MKKMILTLILLAVAVNAAALNVDQVMTASFDGSAGAIKVQWAKNDAEIISALTNTVQNVFDVKHTTTGVPANGIGAALTFTQETSAANNELGMSFTALTTDVTAGSEDFDFVLKLMAAGAAAAERLRVSSTGVITLINSETIDNSVNGTVTYTAPTSAFVGAMTVSGTLGIGGALTLSNAETISNGTNGRIDLNGDVYLNGAVKSKVCTLTKDDATPDIAGCYFIETVANDNPLEITDLDNPVVGSTVVIVGTSAANAPTIADAGNFALSAGWTGGVDETLTLYIQADNDYIEVARSTN